MPIIESSKDILYIVVAFCVLWFTVFVCWFIYYIIKIMKQVNDAILEVSEKLRLLENFITLMKEKVEKSSSYLYIIAEGVKQGVGYLLKKKFVDDEGSSKSNKKK